MGKKKNSEKCREKCPDCLQCQACSKSRCRLCRREGGPVNGLKPGTGFTYGEYLAWRESKEA